jgi:hypothetical protein
MEGVKDMTEEKTRNAANVRFYCDEAETRWEERTDPVTKRNVGGWEDKSNWMLYPHAVRPGCKFTLPGGRKVGPAETFVDYMDGEAPENQADVRATISVSLLLHPT